jgi:N-acetylmuramoyl-L-alanine amidase
MLTHFKTIRWVERILPLFFSVPLLLPRRKIVGTATIAVLAALPLSAQYVRFTKAYGKHYVYLVDVARYYGMRLRVGRKKCFMTSKYSQLSFTFNKRAGFINNVKVNFMNAPFINKGKPFVSEHDFLLLIDPVLRKKALRRHKLTTIMIDPGHGKQDTGAIGARYKEKNIVLLIAKELKKKLTLLGFKVLMTRSSDKFPSLKDRSDLANKLKPDIFISIHCNSAASKTADGVETYCMTPAGEASSSEHTPQSAKQKGNNHDKENVRLAYEIQKNLIRCTKATDRGVKFARFFVLKNINCPGVLVETGFLSNSSEEARLGRESYRAKIVNGLLKGILAYKRATK